MSGWSSTLKGAVKGLGRGGKDLLKHAISNPKGVAGLGLTGVAGWNYLVNDKSVLESVVAPVAGKDVSDAMDKGGAVDAAQVLLFGKKAADKSIASNVVDTVVGEGVSEKAGDTLRQSGDYIAGLFKRPDGQVDYIPPTDYDVYKNQAMIEYQQAMMAQQQAAMNGQQVPQVYPAQYPQQGGGLFDGLSPFGGVKSAASSFLNGGTAMSLASLIPAAFLMFGNFGWMGKIASLFLGSLSMKNMRNQQVLAPQQAIPGYSPQMVFAPSGGMSMAEQFGLNNDNNPQRQVHI